ncbi:MAG: hypothetical protein AMS25_12845 [Gemmatimonas sp. SM23_52]|nr:MAG: hypothetical protein AMS25_12845 [Gemmatimonas sp. SM23_52]
MVTGAAGYVGSLLVERLVGSSDVSKVVATDLRPRSDTDGSPAQRRDGKLVEKLGRLDNRDFVKGLESYLPLDAVVHSAFVIRKGYGRTASTAIERANLESCRNVFEFCFRNNVARLIYFSSAAAYGARSENRINHLFKEEEPLREEVYAYGVQKRMSECLLRDLYEEWKPQTRVVVVRPCGITGPRFQGEPTKKISLISLLKKLLPVIPEVSREWARQFVHEEDLADAVGLLLQAEIPRGYEVYNLAPNDYLTASDIAEALGKRTLRIPPWTANLAFHLLWHLTRGTVPTPKGSINFYRHPVNLDGAKIQELGFTYRYGSKQSLLAVRADPGSPRVSA